VNNRELYDLKNDPGETKNVIASHSDVVTRLQTAYDDWWQSVMPHLENEEATGPAENPFKRLYRQQFEQSKNATQ
jgi:arylsulfatase